MVLVSRFPAKQQVLMEALLSPREKHGPTEPPLMRRRKARRSVSPRNFAKFAAHVDDEVRTAGPTMPGA